MSFFRPSRALRRQIAGQPCPACGLRLHHVEVVAWAHEGRTLFLHPACVSLLIEQNEAAATAEEDTVTAANDGANSGLDAENTILQEAE